MKQCHWLELLIFFFYFKKRKYERNRHEDHALGIKLFILVHVAVNHALIAP